MIVILYSLQEHIISGLLFGLLIVPVVSYLMIRHTDSLLFLGVILNFTPYSRQFGNIIIVGTSLIKLFHFTVVEKKKLPFDFITSMWTIIGILLIITIPKWHFISLGLKTTNSIFVIPILIYLLFSSECIDYNGVKRFINYYFPILAIYLLVQFVWHYYS
ncbi:MAG: hypothetical protein Q7U71_05220, partial [bacterium]|nr:hypothetical protein [bacterium]